MYGSSWSIHGLFYLASFWITIWLSLCHSLVRSAILCSFNPPPFEIITWPKYFPRQRGTLYTLLTENIIDICSYGRIKSSWSLSPAGGGRMHNVDKKFNRGWIGTYDQFVTFKWWKRIIPITATTKISSHLQTSLERKWQKLRLVYGNIF